MSSPGPGAPPCSGPFRADSAAITAEPSPARVELQRRLDRSPLQVAKQLSRHYGHALPEPVYIPAIAMIGRLRYGELAPDDQQQTDVERIVLPYFEGSKEAATSSGNSIGGSAASAIDGTPL